MNEADFEVPPDLADRVAGELFPDERLVWIGQPRLDLAVRPAYFQVPCGIVITGMALVWIVVAIQIAAGIAAPCSLPFIAVGVLLIVSPVWLRAMARKTVYALSDRRAIIWQPSWFGRVTVESFTASGLGQMSRTERPDGSGDLVFQVYTTGYGEQAQTVRRGFIGIDRVRDVEQMVRKTLQAGR
jgi:hypothetical protein